MDPYLEGELWTRVPLREPDADVPLDLQRAFSTIYEASPYAVAIDYSQPPDVPLSAAAAAWSAEQIRKGSAACGVRNDCSLVDVADESGTIASRFRTQCRRPRQHGNHRFR